MEKKKKKPEEEGAGCSSEAGFKDARTLKGVSEWAKFGSRTGMLEEVV